MVETDVAPVFTLEHARAAGLHKDQVYGLLAKGEIERVGRGVYLRPNIIDPAYEVLAAATAVRQEATLCLTSALVHHELSDAIPFGTDIALPRGVHHPAGFATVTWRSFNPESFSVGREQVEVGDGCTSRSTRLRGRS